MSINSIDFLNISSSSELNQVIAQSTNEVWLLDILCTHPFFSFENLKTIIKLELNFGSALENIKEEHTYYQLWEYLKEDTEEYVSQIADLAFWGGTPAPILHEIAQEGYIFGVVVNENTSAETLELALKYEDNIEFGLFDIFSHKNYIPQPLPASLFVLGKSYLDGVARNVNTRPEDLVRLSEYFNNIPDSQKRFDALRNILSNPSTPTHLLEEMLEDFKKKVGEGKFIHSFPKSTFGIISNPNFPEELLFEYAEKALNNVDFFGLYKHYIVVCAAQNPNIPPYLFEQIKKENNNSYSHTLSENPSMTATMAEEFVKEIELYSAGLGKNLSTPPHILRIMLQSEEANIVFFASENETIPKHERAYYLLKNILDAPNKDYSLSLARNLLKLVPSLPDLFDELGETFLEEAPGFIQWSLALQLLKNKMEDQTC